MTSNPIILYDGVCGLCNRFVQFVLKRDRQGRFRLAALQSNFARDTLRRHGQPNERLLARNDAATAVLEELGGVWRTWAKLLDLLPKGFRDWRYNLVARNRYRIFGKHEACPLPDPKYKHKFIDVD
jgi:predicted DCC family thiol-disulfide oxidoreductase YuxK